MSGLKINLEKSEMILVGEVDNLEDLACEIGCKVGKLPSSYLGLPWELFTSWWWFGMGLKNDFIRGFCYGRDNTSQKGEDSLYFAIP